MSLLIVISQSPSSVRRFSACRVNCRVLIMSVLTGYPHLQHGRHLESQSFPWNQPQLWPKTPGPSPGNQCDVLNVTHSSSSFLSSVPSPLFSTSCLVSSLFPFSRRVSLSQLCSCLPGPDPHPSAYLPLAQRMWPSRLLLVPSPRRVREKSTCPRHMPQKQQDGGVGWTSNRARLLNR